MTAEDQPDDGSAPSERVSDGSDEPGEQPSQDQPPRDDPLEEPSEGAPGEEPPDAQGDGQPPGGRPPDQDSAESGGGSSLGLRIGIFLLSVLLFASVTGGILIYTAQGTVLNDQYVVDTLEAEGTYAELETTAEDFAVNQTEGSLGRVSEVVPNAQSIVEDTAREAVTEAYVKEEVNRNLRGGYDYLHGRNSTLSLTIRTETVVDGISDAVEDDLRNFPIADILEQTGIEESFQGYRIDFGRVGQALNDETTFYEVQQDIRRDATAAGVTSEEINETVRADISPPPEVEDSIYRIQGVIVLAMTSEMPYEEFQDRLDRARDQFARDAGAYAEEQVREQVPAVIDLLDEMDANAEQDARNTASTAADIVQLMDTLALVLPILALIIIAALLGLSHTISGTARNAGITLAIAGLLGAAIGFLGKSVVVTLAEEAASGAEDFATTTITALVEGVFGTLTTNGLIILIIGVLLVVVWFLLRRFEPEQIPRSWR